MPPCPTELRERANRVAERFHLDAPSWHREADETPHLTAVADAVWAQRTIVVRYERWAAPTEVTRTVRPYGLVLKAGHWYLVARSAGELRTYRVARILELAVGEPFERDPDFDLAEHWRDYLDRYDARRLAARATVRLSPVGLERLPDFLDAAAIAAAAQTAPDADGWTTVTIPIESVARAVPELLAFGADAEVVAPRELRDRLAATARAMVTAYGSSS